MMQQINVRPGLSAVVQTIPPEVLAFWRASGKGVWRRYEMALVLGWEPLLSLAMRECCAVTPNLNPGPTYHVDALRVWYQATRRAWSGYAPEDAQEAWVPFVERMLNDGGSGDVELDAALRRVLPSFHPAKETS